MLTADLALASIEVSEFPGVRAFNPATLSNDDAREDLLSAVGAAGVVVLRLLGGKQAMPGTFWT